MSGGICHLLLVRIGDSWPQRGTVGELNTLIKGGRWWKEFEAGQGSKSMDYGKLKTFFTYCSASLWSGSGNPRNRVSVRCLA